MKLTLTLLVCTFLCACRSAPAGIDANVEPAWTQGPARQIEGNQLVYVGSANAVSKDLAISKAEGAALEDLANECSLIPKSTRVESRYSVRGTYEYSVFVKISADRLECETAKSVSEPAQIRYYAHQPLTVQLKKYQDAPDGNGATVVEVEPPAELPAAPERDTHWNDTQTYYVLRQAAAYLKQFPVLAPAEAYAAFSTQSKQFAAAAQSLVHRIYFMQLNNPALKEKPIAWSQVPERPRFLRPGALLQAAVPKPERKPPRKSGGPVRPKPGR